MIEMIYWRRLKQNLAFCFLSLSSLFIREREKSGENLTDFEKFRNMHNGVKADIIIFIQSDKDAVDG